MFLVMGTYAKTTAQENNEFSAFAKTEKILMLKAYAHKDIAGYRKNLDIFLARYDTLNDKNKRMYSWELDEEYYLLACAYAHAGNKKNALDYLEKSNDDDYDELKNDHDLDNLRKEPKFIKMLAAAKEKKAGYRFTLQKAPGYNLNEKNDLPTFTYQPADDANLMALKKVFNLDSIAGGGYDETRMINLLHWAHNIIKHNGNKGNPDVKNGYHGAMADPAKFNAQVKVFFLSIGTAENVAGARATHAALNAAGIKHVYYEAPGTAHEWQTWRKSLHEFAPLLFQN